MSTVALGPSARAFERVQIALALSGWELKNAEIDHVHGRIRIEISRGCRHVTLDAHRNGASVSRESWTVEQVTIGRRGDRSIADRIVPYFLGRECFGSVQSALRYFANYAQDNGNGQLVGHQAFQALLT